MNLFPVIDFVSNFAYFLNSASLKIFFCQESVTSSTAASLSGVAGRESELSERSDGREEVTGRTLMWNLKLLMLSLQR